MADDDDKRKRFLEDDDDDLPPPRPKRRGADGPPVLFLVGLVAGVLAVTGCCGAGGWWVFANVLRGGSGSGGWSLFAADEVRITTATRGPGFGFNGGAPQVSWAAVVTTNGATDLHQYVLVMKSGTVTVTEPFPMSPFKDTNISQSMPRPQFRNVTGPIDVWVEKRTNPNQSGRKVSNTFTIR